MDSIGKRMEVFQNDQTIKTGVLEKKEGEALVEKPKDGYAGTVQKESTTGSEIKKDVLSFTDKVSATVGNLVGLVGGTAGLYAGAAGGAVLIGALGLGLGPAVAALTTSGILAGFGTTFAAAGLGAKVGIVAGSLTTGLGMFKAGKKLVDLAVDYIPRKIFGKPEKPKPEEDGEPKKSGLVSGLTAAVGAGSGAVGGAMVGAGIASTGSLISGALATGVTLSAVMGAGIVGAGVGAALFGIGGAVGAWSMVNSVKKGAKWVADKIFQGKQFAELQKKEELLADKEAQLKGLTGDLSKTTGDAKTLHATRSEEQDKKDAFLKAEEKRLQEKEANMDKIIDDKSDAMYKDKAKELFVKEEQQNKREVSLNEWQKKNEDKEKTLDHHIEVGAQALYDKRKVELENQYQGKFNELDKWKTQLNEREKNMDIEVNNKVEAKVKPLEAEWNHKIENARELERDAERKNYQATENERRSQQVLQDAERERQAASNEHQAASNEREKYVRMNNELEGERVELRNERYRIEDEKRRLAEKEAYLNQWEQQLKDKQG